MRTFHRRHIGTVIGGSTGLRVLIACEMARIWATILDM